MVAPAPNPPPPAPTPTRSSLAAALFAVMFVVSATIAIFSAWLLLHGEQTDAVLEALPADCMAVILIDEPAAVARAWQTTAGLANLPAMATATAHEQAVLWQSLIAAPGVDLTRPWALCLRPEGVVAAVVAAPGGTQMSGTVAGTLVGDTTPGQVWLERMALQPVPLRTWGLDLPWPPAGQGMWLPEPIRQVQGQPADHVGRAVRLDAADRARAAVQRTGDVLQIAWVAQGGDARALLDRAIADIHKKPLKENEPFRAAVERVGGGQMHLYLAPALVRQAGERLGVHAEIAEGLATVEWAAFALRQEQQDVRVHAQLGTGQRGAVWLKERLDTQTTLDAKPLVDATAIAVGVVRFQPQNLPMHKGLPGVAALEAWVTGHTDVTLPALAELSTGQAVWQVLPGPEVAGEPPWLVLVPLQAENKAAAAVRAGQIVRKAGQRLVNDHLVLARDDGLAQIGADLATGKRPAMPKLSMDRKRLLTDTQGLILQNGAHFGALRGPLQLEWLWLDTGLVAELTLGR